MVLGYGTFIHDLETKYVLCSRDLFLFTHRFNQLMKQMSFNRLSDTDAFNRVTELLFSLGVNYLHRHLWEGTSVWCTQEL